MKKLGNKGFHFGLFSCEFMFVHLESRLHLHFPRHQVVMYLHIISSPVTERLDSYSHPSEDYDRLDRRIFSPTISDVNHLNVSYDVFIIHGCNIYTRRNINEISYFKFSLALSSSTAYLQSTSCGLSI